MFDNKRINSRPVLSVITPVYNCEEYIDDCVRSLMNQTLEEIEFIFIDDFSTDGSLERLNEILDEFPEKSGRVRIIRHSQNKGVSYSRSEGLSVAEGEWIIFCDADDEVEKNAYELMHDAALEKVSDIVICGYQIFGDVGLRIYNQGIGEIEADELIAGICGSSKKKMHGALWNKMIRRSLWKNVTFPDGLNYCEDEVALFQILLKQPKIFIIKDILYKYRIRDNSLISSKDDTMDRQCDILIPFLSNLKMQASKCQRDAFDAKIIKLLYRLLKSKRLGISKLSAQYGCWYDKICLEKQMNIFERMHLRCSLKGKIFISRIIGFCNDSGYRLVKLIGW